jgi:lysophospholipase L1-like esterase
MLERRFCDELNPGVMPLQAAFYNQAVIADRTSWLAPRVGYEARARIYDGPSQRLLAPDKVLSIVSLGVNDAWVHPKTGESVTPLPEFADHTQKIADTLSALGSVMFIGFTSCDERRYDTIFAQEFGPTYDQYEALHRYEKTALDIYHNVGAVTLPLVDATKNRPDFYQGLSSDGLHPNDAGYTWLLEQIQPHFDNVVGISAEASPVQVQ